MQPPLNSKQPKNPFMYHSAFKLSIYFSNSKHHCKPLHSVETSTTFAQVLHNKVKEIQMNRRSGYQYLLDTVIDMQHKIHNAFLYDAFEENICLAKFTGGKWRHIIEPDFSKEFIQISRKFSIKNNFVILHDLPFNKLIENAKF